MTENLHFSRFSGEEVRQVIPDLGMLRITVFSEYPYLYEGSMEYESDYLRTYTLSPESFVFMVCDGGKPVGATTCIPLINEMEEIREPFRRAGIDPATVMYFGESILLPAYRGRGLGHRFFDEREQFTRERTACSITAFCAVDRPDNHPLKPQGYRSNAAFWEARGYTRRPELQCRLSWLDRGETVETEKILTFYLREWN
jgi:GNAT superfamily N-acetyltransferase